MAGETELFIDYPVVTSAASVYGATADAFKATIAPINNAAENLQKTSLVGQSGDASYKGLEALVPQINAIVAKMQKMQQDMSQAVADYQSTDNSLKTN